MKVKNENLVAYCGLYCPRCYRMKVSEAAEMLRKELKLAKDKGAPYLDDCGAGFKKKLNTLIKLRCDEFCRNRKELKCKIKKCCIDKKLDGCWQCLDFKKCGKLKKQFIENCKKIKKLGLNIFVKNYD